MMPLQQLLGISGTYMELTSIFGTIKWDFQTLYVQFPSQLKNGTTHYTPKEAAKMSAWGFNEAATAVGMMLAAVKKPEKLSWRDVQNMFVVSASAFISTHAGGQAIVTNKPSSRNTIVTPAKWGDSKHY